MTSEATTSKNYSELAALPLSFSNRILHFESEKGELDEALKKRGNFEVFSLWNGLPENTIKLDEEDKKIPFTNLAKFSGAFFDYVIITTSLCSCIDLRDLMHEINRTLAENGFALFAFPKDTSPETINSIFDNSGIAIYKTRIRETNISAENELTILAVHIEYDPIAHAHKLYNAGCPDFSLEVLHVIPEEFSATPEHRASVLNEMLRCELALSKQADSVETVRHFSNAQAYFYMTVDKVTDYFEAYANYSHLWHQIGNDAMACKVLQSFSHAMPAAPVQEQIAGYNPASYSNFKRELPLSWIKPDKLPRILFITHKRPDFGLDVLFDGLCNILGPENVIDFPWKPSLHGKIAEEQKHYPCMFNHPGDPLSIKEVSQMLLNGHFDMMIFGDTEGHLDFPLVQLLMKAGTNCPFFIVDEGDDPIDQRNILKLYLERKPLAYFKREMLTCRDYGQNIFSLPFAYPIELIPEDLNFENRKRDLFWAGHRMFGLRKLYLEYLERTCGYELDVKFTQEEYATALRDARIGLNIFGYGYDTVRYWEIPANGAMLLAERMPITIHNNFIDGESAVFFDNLEDLENKLKYYLKHEEERKEIAKAGYQYLKKYHTNTVRAKQFLAWTNEIL